MKTTTFFKNATMFLTAATITACSSDLGVYDASSMEQQTKQTYAENFARKYADVNMNQSWDYSHKQSDFRIAGAASQARTRAGEGKFSMGGWYEVDNNTLSWMHEQLVEGQNHTNLGRPFYMKAPGNDFTIVPIYQGQAGAMWNLHVVVDGVDYKVWEKINFASLGGTEPAEGERAEQNETKEGTIQIKDADNDQWHNLHGQWFDWGYGHWNSLYNTDGTDRWTPDWSGRNNVTAVRSRSYTFTGFPLGTEMYFYLEITVDGNGEENGVYMYRNEVGAHMSSLKGMMLALTDCPVPANLTGQEAMIVGCEDADQEASDWDMNDLVLLVYGEHIPQPIEIEEGQSIEDVKTVRYMIEDLGATDDFDFNDVVVDMLEIRTIKPTYTTYSDKTVTTWTETGVRQEAVIRHLGGTLPFTLTIGNTTLPEMGGQSTFQTSPNSVFDVTGWSMDRHNISVQVRQKANAEVYNHVTFPKAGEAPMIIAVDPTQDWMSERKSVPSSWFYIPE